MWRELETGNSRLRCVGYYTRAPQPSSSSLPGTFTAANRKKSAGDATKQEGNFDVLIHHVTEPLSPYCRRN